MSEAEGKPVGERIVIYIEHKCHKCAKKLAKGADVVWVKGAPSLDERFPRTGGVFCSDCAIARY